MTSYGTPRPGPGSRRSSSSGPAPTQRGNARPGERPRDGAVYGGSTYYEGRGGTTYGSPNGSGSSGSSRGPGSRGPTRPATKSSASRQTGLKPPGRSPGTKPRGTGRGRRHRSPWWAKVTLGLGVLVMVAAGVGMVSVNVILGQVNNAVKQVSLLAPGTKAVSIDGAINLLLIGLDTRSNNLAMGSRSDSIIIAHVPASHDHVDLISIPRDTYVPIPANPKTKYYGSTDKINSAFEFGSRNGGGDAGGTQLLQKTVEQNWGITFQGALIVDFSKFTDIVNKLGGVTMYVDENTMSLHHGYVTGHPNERAAPWVINPDGTPNHRIPGTTPVIYKKGTQHLTAYQALDYVRCRDFLPNADYDRQRHQQQFIKALLQEAYDKGISDPLKVSDFLTSLGKAFEFDGGGHPASDWIFTLKGISPSSIRTIKINNGTYNTVMVGNMSTQQMSTLSLQLLADVRSDTVDNFLAAHPDWVSSSG